MINFLKNLVIFSLIIFVCCAFIGRKKEKSFIMFSATPITEGAELFPQTDFQLGQNIYYMIYSPKGFEDDLLRIQVIKKNDKSAHEGYNIRYAQDVEVPLGGKIYTDKLRLYEKGIYVMQATEFSNDTHSLAYGVFGIKDE